MKQKGLAPIYLLIGLVISGITLLIPIPYYQNPVLCTPCPENAACLPCSNKPGWKLGEPLWKKIFSYFSPIKQPNESTVAITPSSSSLPAAGLEPIKASTSAETANWKTYTHKDYHYSIKVPPQFAVDDRFYPQLHITRVNNSRTPDPSLDDINISFWDPATNCSTDTDCFNILEKTYQGAKKASSNEEYNSVISSISGRSIKGIESWSSGVSQGGTVIPSSLTYNFPLSLNDKLFELKFVIGSYQTKDQALVQKELVNQILSTFKFTN